MERPYRYTENTTSFANFWKKGLGKDLLLKIGGPPSLAVGDDLISNLFAWDKLGDQVVIDLYLKKGFKQGTASLNTYLKQEELPHNEQEIWNTFFSSIDINPDWLDKDKLKIGSEFCRRSGLSGLIVLRDYCLMGGYESAAINKPLIYTGALKKGAVKRLTETVEFWVQITKEHGLDHDQEGFKQIFLTRMIHSYSRVSILQHTDWDTKKWGIPLNTWDMLATNLGFSLVFINGLRLIGIQATDKDIEGVLHFWKYIGYLLGIPASLLPDTEAEAIESLYLWTMTQREGDADSLELAKALKEEPVHAYYPKNPLYRKMMREIHLFYNYFFLGEYSCQQLGLPKTTIGRFALVHIWRARQQEAKIIDEKSRQKAIIDGEEEQERVRQIYLTYNQ